MINLLGNLIAPSEGVAAEVKAMKEKRRLRHKMTCKYCGREAELAKPSSDPTIRVEFGALVKRCGCRMIQFAGQGE